MGSVNPFSTVFFPEPTTLGHYFHNFVDGFLNIPHLQKIYKVTDLQKGEVVLDPTSPRLKDYLLTAAKIGLLIAVGWKGLAIVAAVAIVDRLCYRFLVKSETDDPRNDVKERSSKRDPLILVHDNFWDLQDSGTYVFFPNTVFIGKKSENETWGTFYCIDHNGKLEALPYQISFNQNGTFSIPDFKDAALEYSTVNDLFIAYKDLLYRLRQILPLGLELRAPVLKQQADSDLNELTLPKDFEQHKHFVDKFYSISDYYKNRTERDFGDGYQYEIFYSYYDGSIIIKNGLDLYDVNVDNDEIYSKKLKKRFMKIEDLIGAIIKDSNVL